MPAAPDIHPEKIAASFALQSQPLLRESATPALIFFFLVAACCAWILHLPVFPSQDGPVHVYYAHVTRDLMLGGQAYAQQFRVARPFPPYSIHAYILMALLSFTSGAMAEKLLACLAVIVCGAGVFYLARQLGRTTIFAGLAAPFLLNRYLFLGFYGYMIAIGVALMAMGVWLRADRRTPSRRAAFLLLTVLTLFSHPVPYLLLVAFCGAELVAGWWNGRQRSAAIDAPLDPPTPGDWLTFVLAGALFLYIKHYSHSGMLWNYEWLANWDLKLLRMVNVFTTIDLLPLHVLLYNIVLGAALAVATIVALRHARSESKDGRITRAQLVSGFALLIVIALPLLPRTMNGSGFFAERFSILPPLLLMAAACAAPISRSVHRALAAACVITLAVALLVLSSHIAPIANTTNASSIPQGWLAGTRVLAVNESRAPREFSYDPYLMSPVRAVDRSGALLVDSPWMDLQIMMLDEIGPQAKLVRGTHPAIVSGVPVGLVDGHCGATDGDTTAARIAADAPGRWRLSRYGCYDLLQPREQ